MLWQRREILVVERFSPLHLVSRGYKDLALKLAVGFRLYLNRKKIAFFQWRGGEETSFKWR